MMPFLFIIVQLSKYFINLAFLYVSPFLRYNFMATFALVAQRIEQGSSKALMGVRFSPRAQIQWSK